MKELKVVLEGRVEDHTLILMYSSEVYLDGTEVKCKITSAITKLKLTKAQVKELNNRFNGAQSRLNEIVAYYGFTHPLGYQPASKLTFKINP